MFIFFSSIMFSLLNMSFPLLYLMIFNRFIPTQDSDLLLKTNLIAIITAGFVVVFSFLMNQFAIELRMANTRAIRERFVIKMLDFKFEYFQSRQVGDIIQRLIPDLDSLAISMARMCCNAGSMMEIILMIVLLAIYNQNVLVAYGLFAAGNLLWSIVLRNLIVRQKLSLAVNSGKVYGHFFQLLLGVKQIKTMNLLESQISRVRKELGVSHQVSAKAAMLDEALSIGPVVLFRISFLAGLGISFFDLKAENISIGIFIWTLFLLYRMGRPFEELSAFWATLNSGIAAAKRVRPVDATLPEKSGKTIFSGLESGIEFRSVSYWYVPGKPVLKDIDLIIPRGADIAIVGESGSGKTSLLQLLLRVANPNSGNLLVDQRDIAEYEIHSLREKFGLVSQDIFLFNNTIRKNIDFQARHSELRILEICEMCQLSGLLRKSDAGLDTRVGERGLLLSGGEKQRIAIARLIAKDADVIIFDEASSSLDPLVEKSIRDMILAYRSRKPGITTITISHRPNAFSAVETIHVMKEGRIVESGSHGELISLGSHYHRLFAKTQDSEHAPASRS